MDSSDYVRNSRQDLWGQQKTFVRDVIEEMSSRSIDIHVGVVIFSDTASEDIRLGQFTRIDDLLFEVDQLRQSSRGGDADAEYAIRVS